MKPVHATTRPRPAPARPDNGHGALRRRHAVVVSGLVAILVAMGTLVYFAAPLYRLFCQVTGYGGTTQVAAASPSRVLDTKIQVRFDTNVARDLPWRFTAPRPADVRLGDDRLVAFHAVNQGDKPYVGTAVFNVTPLKVGKYFSKIECFCFTEQLLMPGESKEFPVRFFVDPRIHDDPDTRDVEVLTLSYTFFDKGPEALAKHLALAPNEMPRPAATPRGPNRRGIQP